MNCFNFTKKTVTVPEKKNHQPVVCTRLNSSNPERLSYNRL